METNRRTILKQLSLSLVAMSLPSWAHAWQSPSMVGSNELLDSLIDTILPETDSPGAKSIGAHLFIQRMIADCFDVKTREVFSQGILSFDEQCIRLFGMGFEKLPSNKKIDFLKNIEKRGSSEDKLLLQILKRLTIQAYTNSEYFLKNHRNYSIAPGFYHGCTPIKA